MKIKDLLEACWKNYKQVGMKKKNGKQVPNCVAKESASMGATASGNIATNVATGSYGNGFLNGGPGATSKKKKKKIIKR